jgi:hypothetical protein
MYPAFEKTLTIRWRIQLCRQLNRSQSYRTPQSDPQVSFQKTLDRFGGLALYKTIRATAMSREVREKLQ